MPLAHDIVKTLLYYDIFSYPLRDDEIFAFLPSNSIMPKDILQELESMVSDGSVYADRGFYSIRSGVHQQVDRRLSMELYARRHWRVARFMTQIIKRCPFVDAVMITGTLGKNLSAPELDIDFFIVTQPRRLWIARTLLILFKKLFLLNSRKYFCLNYFITADDLEIEEKNIFTATEIAHIKVLYNSSLLLSFLEANEWISHFFPNWSMDKMPLIRPNNRRSIFATVAGYVLPGTFGDRVDSMLMQVWENVWKRRYPDLSEERRNALFRVSATRSKAHEPDFQTRILSAYEERCLAHVPPLEASS